MPIKTSINNTQINILFTLGRRVLVGLVYRLYVLPSSLLALWGLLFLCVAIVIFMDWGKYLVVYAFSQGIDSINLTNDDFIRFVGTVSAVGVIFFEGIRLIFRRSIDYRAAERKLRLALIVICWPLADFIFSLSSPKYKQSWGGILFIVGLGISLIGIEVLADKAWSRFEKFFLKEFNK